MDFYQLAKALGWSWRDWCETPKLVRQLCWIYGQAEAEEQTDRAKER
jgi:hypothetical protein